MFYLILGFLIIVARLLFIRYFPVQDVQCVSLKETNIDATIVDVRDYNESYKDSIQDSIHMPVAYLNRNYKDIPKLQVLVVASNHLEKNISIRFLRKKGFHVKGYRITNAKCNDRYKYDTGNRKVCHHGI